LLGKTLIKDSFELSVDYSNYFNSDKKQFGKSTNEKIANSLNLQLKIDYNGRLKSYLKCEDRCSMAFGIESRVPFADDVELVNYIFSIQGSQKIKNGISKYLLREASKKYIPNSIYSRKDKIGFETPVQKWFSPYKVQILDLISLELSFVNIEYLTNNFNEVLKHKPNFVIRLYSLAVWKRVFSQI